MLDALILLTLAAFFLKGFVSGDNRELRILMSWALSLLFAYSLSPWCVARVYAYWELPEEITRVIVFMLIACGIYLLSVPVFSFFSQDGKIFYKLEVKRRILGGCVSLLKGLLIIICLCTLLSQMPLEWARFDNSTLVQALTLR